MRQSRRARHVSAVVASMRQRDYEEADRLCSRWLAAHPSDLGILEQFAFSAHNRGLYAEAKRRWAALLAQAPHMAMAHCGLACNHRELGELDAAAAVMIPALAAFPGEPGLRGEAERIGRRLSPSDRAERLWAAMLAGDPDDVDSRLVHAEVLAGIGRFAEALAAIDSLLETAPVSTDLLLRGVRIALDGGDWLRAVGLHDRLPKAATHTPDLERRVTERAGAIAAAAAALRPERPDKSLVLYKLLASYASSNADWYRATIDLLAEAGRLEEAARHFACAGTLHRGTWQMLLAGCKLAARDGRLDEAEAGLQRFREREGDADEMAALQAELATARAMLADGCHPAQAENRVKERAREAARTERIKDMLLRFEGIGQNCEFGLVQRMHDADPLGLFRFNATTVDTLEAALAARLEGLGEPEFTRMPLWEDYEYYLTDTRWGFGFHTHKTKAQVAHDVLYPHVCRHLVFLKDKFIEDLSEAAKVFVLSLDSVDAEALLRLHGRMRDFGPARLLCVLPIAEAGTLGHDEARVGDLVEVADGLHVGYLSWLGRATVGGWRIQIEEWVALCEFYLASVLGEAIEPSVVAQPKLLVARDESGTLVFDGDSISVSSGVPAGDRLHEQVARALGFAGTVPVVGCGGRPVRDCDRLFSELVLPRRRPGPKVIAFHAGDNDIAAGSDADTAYGALRSYIDKAHRAGFKVVVSTALQRFDFPPPWQAELARYNALMLANAAGADGVVDYGGDPLMGPRKPRSDAALYQADGVHPTAAGYAVLCPATVAALRPLLA